MCTGGLQACLAGSQSAMAQVINLDKAMQDKPVQDRGFSDHHYALSRRYDDDNDLAKALAEMQLAVQFNENDASVHVGLADILARTGKVTEAIEEARKAARLDPKDPEPHWTLATIYLRAAEGNQQAGDAIEQAAVESESMKGIAPDDQRADFGFGERHRTVTSPTRRSPRWNAGRLWFRDSEQGYIVIAQYYERQGNQDKAIEYLKKAVEATLIPSRRWQCWP